MKQGDETLTAEQLEQILKDYFWMMNSVKVMREDMSEVGEGVTAQYGDDAGMPKAIGSHSDPVYREYNRREKRWKTIDEYEQKLGLIQGKIHLLTEAREKEVLHWLLEGKSMRWIGSHMGLSHTNIQRIKDHILQKLTTESVPNVPNVP